MSKQIYYKLHHLPTNTIISSIKTDYIEETELAMVELATDINKLSYLSFDTLTSGVVYIPEKILHESILSIIKTDE